MLNLSYIGDKEGLLEYIHDHTCNCSICKDEGRVEVMGDGANFEWDVVGFKTCECKNE